MFEAILTPSANRKYSSAFRKFLTPSYWPRIQNSEPIITAISNEVISVEDSSPPSLQSTSTSRLSLDKTSEIARQQSISRTKQTRPERPHAGSTALSSRPKNPPKGSQLISQSFPVNIYVYRGTLFDVELENPKTHRGSWSLSELGRADTLSTTV